METKPPSHNSSVGYNIHHFEWCTKYRYRMFRREKYKKICEEFENKIFKFRNLRFRKAIIVMAERHDIQIRELSVMPEHIHVSAELPPQMSQSEALQVLKGGTSYIIFRKVPEFKLRYPKGNLWSKGKYRGSTGPADVEKIDSYVKNQEHLHQKTLKEYSPK